MSVYATSSARWCDFKVNMIALERKSGVIVALNLGEAAQRSNKLQSTQSIPSSICMKILTDFQLWPLTFLLRSISKAFHTSVLWLIVSILQRAFVHNGPLVTQTLFIDRTSVHIDLLTWVRRNACLERTGKEVFWWNLKEEGEEHFLPCD